MFHARPISNRTIYSERYHMQILTSVHFYLPGYKAGGPIRTLSNLVDQLGNEFAFHIVTSDRDYGDSQPYVDVDLTDWNAMGSTKVKYIGTSFVGLFRLVLVFMRTPHDILYLNSLFDPAYAVLPLVLRKLRLGSSKPIIIAPRGELSLGALELKKAKKLLFLRAAKLARLYKGVIWQASSKYEAIDIKTWIGRDARIVIAVNLPSSMECEEKETAHTQQEKPALQLVFLSRISPKKNLEFALRVLKLVSVPIDFAIYGPHEDRTYLAKCRELAETMPDHVKVEWHCAVPPTQVANVLSQYDLFFFPTKGENYGHVIAESLSVGTPLLISDTTPWRDLEAAGVGWDVGLENEDTFVECIERCAQISPKDYAAWREQVKAYARVKLAVDEIVDANRHLFLSSV